MAKVELNYGPIENSCISSLESVISSLGEAISYLQQSFIPSDFYRRTTLSNTIEDLKVRKEQLSNIRNWLVNSNKNYNSMIDKLNIQANQLPVYQVKRRNTIV